MLAFGSVAYADVHADPYYATAGETVAITGDGMNANADVTVDVTYPDDSLAQEHVVQADDQGNFEDSYLVKDTDPSGVYTVTATDGDHTFQTTFDPPPPPTFSASISGPNSAFAGVATTYTANTNAQANCLNGATLGYSWSTTAGTANFSATNVQAPDVTFTSTGTVTLKVTVTRTGGTCDNTSADGTKDVDVTSTTTTMTFNPASPITYGHTTDISGTLRDNTNEGIAGQSIVVTRNDASDCTGSTLGTLGTFTTSGGPSTPPKGNWPDLVADGFSAYSYLPNAAGDQYLKAAFAGTGSRAPSSDCETLAVDEADTTTTSQPSDSTGTLITQIGIGIPFWLQYEVSSDDGVTGNTATGNVAAHQSGAGLGCDTSDHAISASQTTGSGFDYVANNTTNSSNRINCTATAGGTYTVYASFTDTDGNYNDSDDSPGSSVEVTTVQACTAAPSIAAAWLQAHNIKSGSSKYVNIVSLIAQEMTKGAYFPHYTGDGSTPSGSPLGPCDAGYAASVQLRTAYLADNRTTKK